MEFNGGGIAGAQGCEVALLPPLPAASSSARDPGELHAPAEAPAAAEQLQQRRWVDPARLTREIVAASNVHELQALWRHYCPQQQQQGQQQPAGYDNGVNGVHVSAALVRLAKLAQQPAPPEPPPAHPQGSAPPAAHVQGASSQPAATAAEAGTQPEAPQARRRRQWHTAAPQHLPPAAPNGHTHHHHRHHQSSSTAATVASLAGELAQQYVAHAPSYTIARQHANVCWALGALREHAGLQPGADVLRCTHQHLLASQARLLLAAKPQELSNLAWGLTKLDYWRAPPPGASSAHMLSALLQACDGRLEHFKPQELSNLVWALARAADAALLPASTPTAGTAAAPSVSQVARRLRLLVGAALRLASRQVRAFKPQELVSLLWSAAHLATGGVGGGNAGDVSRLFEASAPALRQHAKARALNGQDVSNCVWAYARLGLYGAGTQLLAAWAPPPPSSPSPPTHQQQHQQQQLDAQDAAPLANGGREQQQQQQQHGGGDGEPLAALRDCTADELSNVLWACARCAQHHQQQRHPRAGAAAAAAAMPLRPGGEAELAAVQRLGGWALARMVSLAAARAHGGGRALAPTSLAGAAWAAARMRLVDTASRVAVVHMAAQQVRARRVPRGHCVR